MTEEKQTRGKRRFANYTAIFYALFLIGGIFNEQMWEIAKAHTVYVFPLIVALYGLDEHYRTQRVQQSRGVGGFQPAVGRRPFSFGQRPSWQDQYPDFGHQPSRQPQDRNLWAETPAPYYTRYEYDQQHQQSDLADHSVRSGSGTGQSA